MTYPCHLPEAQSWNPAGKLDHCHPQAWLQRSAGQNSSRDTVPDTSSDQSGSECNSKTGLLHGTHLSLPLRSMVQGVTACLQWHHAGAKRTTQGAAGRRRLPGAHASSKLNPNKPAGLAAGTGSSSGFPGRSGGCWRWVQLSGVPGRLLRLVRLSGREGPLPLSRWAPEPAERGLWREEHQGKSLLTHSSPDG